MRAFTVALLLLTSVATAQDSRKTTQADFMIGQVKSALGSRYIIDLGYANGFREQQRFALFRSERLAWVPVGVVEVSNVGSTTSRVRSIRGLNPRKGDLVFVAYSTLGYITDSKRDDNYVRQRILSWHGKNGYDTGTIIHDARQLASQKRSARRWYKQGAASGLRIIYGTSKVAYESDRVRNLASQCRMLSEFQTESPGAFRSLSPRWAQVLPEVTGYTPPPEEAKKGESAEEDPDEFAEPTPNLLPMVEREYAEEPRAVRETYAVILGAVASRSPPNPAAYIRDRLKRTQFPHLADEPDTIERLDNFLLTINDLSGQ